MCRARRFIRGRAPLVIPAARIMIAVAMYQLQLAGRSGVEMAGIFTALRCKMRVAGPKLDQGRPGQGRGKNFGRWNASVGMKASRENTC